MSRGGIGNIERSGLAVDPQYDGEGVPEVTILLLGDAEVGKSTLLSYVSPVIICALDLPSFWADLKR
jgi:hypothetical protein